MLIPLVQIFHISDEHVTTDSTLQQFLGGNNAIAAVIQKVLHEIKKRPSVANNKSKLKQWLNHLTPKMLDELLDGLAGHERSCEVEFSEFLSNWCAGMPNSANQNIKACANLWHGNTSNNVLCSTGDNTTFGDDSSFQLYSDYWDGWCRTVSVKATGQVFGNHDLWPGAYVLAKNLADFSQQRINTQLQFGLHKDGGCLRTKIAQGAGAIELVRVDTNANNIKEAALAIGDLTVTDKADLLRPQPDKAFRILLSHYPIYNTDANAALGHKTRYLADSDTIWADIKNTSATHLVLCGHSHKTFEKVETNHNGETNVAQFAVGALMSATCDTSVDDQLIDLRAAQIIQIFLDDNYDPNSGLHYIVRRIPVHQTSNGDYIAEISATQPCPEHHFYL